MSTDTNCNRDSCLVEITALSAEVKSLTKIVRKIKAKLDDPTGEKSTNRAKNNGFNREQKVSDKLRDFLDLPADKLVSRSFVTRAINKYVKDN